MKKSYYTIVFFLSFITCAHAQQALLPDVPDFSQPPTANLPSTVNITNYCAPFAFTNIVAYWDNVQNHPYALGITAGLPGPEVAEYIGWFMDTNDHGSPFRLNGVALTSSVGTYYFDQMEGALEYINFNM